MPPPTLRSPARPARYEIQANRVPHAARRLRIVPRRRMTVLFVTTILPGARTTGSEVCSAAFVDALRARGERVIVLGYHRRGDALLRPGPDDVAPCERRIETRG